MDSLKSLKCILPSSSQKEEFIEQLASLKCVWPSSSRHGENLNESQVSGFPLRKSYQTRVQHPHSDRYWAKTTNNYRDEPRRGRPGASFASQRRSRGTSLPRQRRPVAPPAASTYPQAVDDIYLGLATSSGQQLWDERDHPHNHEHYDHILECSPEKTSFLDLDLSGFTPRKPSVGSAHSKELFQEYLRLKAISDKHERKAQRSSLTPSTSSHVRQDKPRQTPLIKIGLDEEESNILVNHPYKQESGTRFVGNLIPNYDDEFETRNPTPSMNHQIEEFQHNHSEKVIEKRNATPREHQNYMNQIKEIRQTRDAAPREYQRNDIHSMNQIEFRRNHMGKVSPLDSLGYNTERKTSYSRENNINITRESEGDEEEHNHIVSNIIRDFQEEEEQQQHFHPSKNLRYSTSFSSHKSSHPQPQKFFPHSIALEPVSPTPFTQGMIHRPITPDESTRSAIQTYAHPTFEEEEESRPATTTTREKAGLHQNLYRTNWKNLPTKPMPTSHHSSVQNIRQVSPDSQGNNHLGHRQVFPNQRIRVFSNSASRNKLADQRRQITPHSQSAETRSIHFHLDDISAQPPSVQVQHYRPRQQERRHDDSPTKTCIPKFAQESIKRLPALVKGNRYNTLVDDTPPPQQRYHRRVEL